MIDCIGDLFVPVVCWPLARRLKPSNRKTKRILAQFCTVSPGNCTAGCDKKSAMENNEYRQGQQGGGKGQGQPKEAPGQTLPSANDKSSAESGGPSKAKEQHSESSRPQKDNETLGTP
jgi:hypothetical protein